jgi:hypothetical protein
VRSLTAFPHVLDTMARHMAWTEDLGQAFIIQPQDVMDTVQRLRYRAREAGTLTSSEYTRVIDTGASLVIESIQPQVVHVPHYDTTVAYGPWWWPTRPPMYWPRWHGYYDPVGRPRVVHWGPGTWVNSGFFFGGFDWSRREVRVVNTRSYYYARPVYGQPVPHAGAPQVWRHDYARRSEWRQRTQPAERPVQAQQRPPQARPQQPATGPTIPREAQPPTTGAAVPREARVQGDGDEPRFERRARRSRDADDDSSARAGPAMAPQRSAANPAAQPPAAARAPAITPSAPSPPAATAPAPVRSALPPSEASREDAPRRRSSRGRDSD